jgi:hypothetical protein
MGTHEDPLELADVLQRPDRVAELVRSNMYGTYVNRWARCHGGVIFDLTFRALPNLTDFPDERARVSVRPDGEVYAFPLGPSPRRWQHRQPSPLGPGFGHLAADLCLFYPGDPRSLRWEWPDGLIAYIVRVQRHLFFEEHWRRTGNWPVEDAPHGEPAVDVHPIETKFMRREEQRWARILRSAS